MTKKILAAILTFALVLSMMPATVLAEGASNVTASPYANTHSDAGHSDDCGVTDGWLPWDKTDSLPTKGKYYLTDNVELSGEQYLMEDLTLCLNGFVVSTKHDSKRLISTAAGTGITLTITDCTARTENGVYYAGALTDGKDSSSLGGGAILVRYGTTAHFYDGRITGNTSATAGGALRLHEPTGTYEGAKFYMHGGEIAGNTAINGTSYKTGGAIYMGNNTLFEMTGGTIKGNTGSGGGVLYAVDNATINIKNATITGNTASFAGAVLHCARGAQVTIADSRITGNTCTSSSGGGIIRMDGSKGKVTLSGNTVIADNTLAAGIGDIMLTSTYSDTLHVKDLDAGSYVKFCTPNTIPASAPEVIDAAGGQTLAWNNGSVVFIGKDGSEKHIAYDGSSFSFVDGHFHGNKEFKLWDQPGLPTEGCYYLDNDIQASAEATISGNLELCMNGCTVNGYQGGRAYTVNGTLTIYNCGSKGGFAGFSHSAHGGAIMSAGTVYAENITFQNNRTTAGYGGALLSTGGNLTFKNCVFHNNSASQGGALSIGGQATITGCTFTENSASNAGAIRAAGSKTVLIDNSSFTGNNATVISAISAASSGVSLTLKDVTVTGNTSTSGYGAVNMLGSAKPIKLQGIVNVTGNTKGSDPDNLHVQNGTTDGYDVTGLSAGSQLGISLEGSRITAGKLHFTTASAANNKGYFTSNVAGYVVDLNTDNKLYLKKDTTPQPPVSDHEHNLCNDDSCGVHTSDVAYLPWPESNSLPTEGHWYLTKNVTVSAEASISKDLDLCLNGKTVTGNGCRAYNISAGANVNISNCKTTGSLTGFSTNDKNGGGTFYNAGTLSFFGVGIENSTSSNGGGGAIYNAGVLNLYKAALSGNQETAGKHGGAVFNAGTMYAQNTTFDNNHADKNIGGAILSAGPLTVKNCVFHKNTAKEGGAVSVAAKTVVEGCTFTENSASTTTGAFRAAGSSTVLIDGCTFTGNRAKVVSAIAAASNGVSLTLKDTTVTGNTNTSGYGAVNMLGGAKPIKLQGTVKVTNNIMGTESSNLHVQNGATDGYDVTGLATGSQLGIRLESARITAGKMHFSTADVSNNKAYFTSDNTEYAVALNADNKLYLKKAEKPLPSSDHKHCLCAGVATSGCDHSTVEFIPWTDPTSLPKDGNWYLSVDVTVSKQTSVSKTLNLCLNGHTIKVGEQGGRVYYGTTGADLRITDCGKTGTITGATNTAILYNANGTDMALTLYGGTLTGNHIIGGGGALSIQGDCEFNMYGGKITGNSATSQLKLDGQGKPALDKDGNQTYLAANGGALFAGSGTTFNMYGGEISGNKITHVEYLKAGETKASKAGGNGGAMAIYGTANLYGGKITGNEAFLGGGVFVSGKTGVLNMLGAEVSANKATSGGGLLSMSGAVINMRSGSVTGNTVTISGGGIYVSINTKLDMTGGCVSDNTSGSHGGGLYLQQSEALISGGKITNNTAAKQGGAINITEKGTLLTLNGGELSGNKAQSGGGVFVLNDARFLMNGGAITKNTVSSAGGGVFISSDTSFTMTGGIIGSNTAKNDGGGLYLLLCTAELNGGSISDNVAANGGGIKINGGKSTFRGVSITGNQAVGKMAISSKTGEPVQVPGTGGGMSVNQGSYTKNGSTYTSIPDVQVYDFYVANNKATSAAGGILVQSKGTRFTMYGGTVTGNDATSGGGGIYFSTGSIANITGGTVSNNTSLKAGGIFFLNCTANVSGLKLTGNKAGSTGGGAIILGEDALVNMRNMQIGNNFAEGTGGALLMQSYATMTLEDSKVYGNRSKTTGGLYFAVPTYGTLKNVELYENESTENAGGAAYVSSNVILTMERCTVRDNKAGGSGGGIYNKGRLVLNGCKMLNNTSGKTGGAVGSGKVASALLSDQAGVYATETLFSGNQATEQGGAIYNNRGCPVYLTDCTLTENTSGAEGSAIYSDGRLGLTNVTATGNTASGSGYALYITPGQYDGHSYTTGHKWISGNMIIKDNSGGDVYLGEGTVLAVTGERLGEKSHVNITLHSGVLSQWVHGVYGYEGGDLVYTLTAGDRSITDPEPIPADEKAADKESGAPNHNIWLYVGIGAMAAILVAVVLILTAKKKKAGKTVAGESQE